MGGSENSSVISNTRLKREDCERTKHDSAFSLWKILIGPSDWEDYLQKKEGAEKYRTQNLPNCASCSGLYELGIAVSLPQSGPEGSKRNSKYIIPVYLGQADIVRTRLQQYGRDGAHLEHGSASAEPNGGCKGHGLFSDIFSRGLAVVFRWAPMKSKTEAENTETWLLDTFDYAWNKGKNGARRPNDIYQKLDRLTSSHTLLSPIVRKLPIFRPRQVGLRIKTREPLLLDNGSSFYTQQNDKNIISRIFTFSRSRPVLVSKEFGVKEGHASICGVALGQGSVCTRPPVEGRKRCADHRGMKVNASMQKLITERDSHDDETIMRGISPTCRVSPDDGSLFARERATARKGCEEHKGRRNNKPFSIPVTEAEKNYVRGPVLSTQKPSTGVNKNIGNICGKDLENGAFCTRQPVIGRKRCEEHKGMRVHQNKAELLYADSGLSISNDRNYNETSFQTGLYRKFLDNSDSASSTCGAVTLNGSFCKRKPGYGSKWCFQHKSTRLDSYSTSQSNGSSSSNGHSYSSTCGAITQKGSFCSRRTADGRRCFQHS